MNEKRTVRRIVASLTIGSFSVAALMGIVALLGSGDFGDDQARVLLTTLIVGSASICVLCYLATAGTRWVAVGVLGGIVAVLPVSTALVLVWRHWDGNDVDGLLRAFGIGVVLALTLAQLCLLLALAGARPGLALVLWATVAMAVVVAGVVCGLITETIDGDIWKFLGIVAILDVLGTLVTIALAKFGGRTEPELPDGRVRATLSAAQSAAINERARLTGRPVEDLLVEAVEHYLR
ncbi:MAG: hypothetical protein NTV23_11670 [Propionibacteriales bacterium]|nr:hypothetical protein [Propionibacteriales bacterium]